MIRTDISDTHRYQCIYLINIPEPVQYHIYALTFPFDLRYKSVTYCYIRKYLYIHTFNVTVPLLMWLEIAAP